MIGLGTGLGTGLETGLRKGLVVMKIEYVIELDISCNETNQTISLFMNREIIGCVQIGHQLIINDTWERVNSMIHDTDQGKVIIYLDKRVVALSEFDHIVRSYRRRGWTLLRETRNGMK